MRGQHFRWSGELYPEELPGEDYDDDLRDPLG